jgi:peptidoglycan-associated lipoprotein
VAGVALVSSGCGITAWFRQASDISGQWSGTWLGHGILAIPREERVTAQFEQRGRFGRGVIALDGTLAVESVPEAIRNAGAPGSRVLFEVSGRDVVVKHELGSEEFIADFRVAGDWLIGHIRGSDPPVRMMLARARSRGYQQQPQPADEPEPIPEAPPAPEPAPEPAGPQPGAEGSPRPADAPPGPESEPGSGAEAGSAPEPGRAERLGLTGFSPAPELKAVHFAFDQADIRPEATDTLNENAQWLKGNDVLVLIEGHADERGTPEYNLALGERRAKAVRAYLIGRGVEADRLNTVSYGEERLVCTEQTENCWRQNRRTEILVKRR